jgi:hypothetical protein
VFEANEIGKKSREQREESNLQKNSLFEDSLDENEIVY